VATNANTETLFINSDMVLEVSNLRDLITDALVTGATVTARVLNAAGAAVGGVSDPLTLTEVAGKSGLYRASVPDGASLSVGDTGTIVVSMDDSTSQREKTVPYRVRNT